MSLILPRTQNRIGVTIDERSIGKNGHQFVGELRCMSWWIGTLQHAYALTRDANERRVLDSLIEVAGEYQEQVESDFLKLAKARKALEVIEGLQGEELSQ